MKQLVFGLACAIATLFISPTTAWAFQLLSPPVQVTMGFGLSCIIFNAAADAKDMEAIIEVLSATGAAISVPAPTCTLSATGNRAFCQTTVVSYSNNPRVCRFIVKGAPKSNVRATAHVTNLSIGEFRIVVEAH
jgi:hypothetical protein